MFISKGSYVVVTLPVPLFVYILAKHSRPMSGVSLILPTKLPTRAGPVLLPNAFCSLLDNGQFHKLCVEGNM